ncbi:hypothetical protein BZA77DRAFT_355470 [Pyronema omphalodes]|nr:hypothetical protein BZA77DRAFT_355470 [Pyronema omphalodes]
MSRSQIHHLEVPHISSRTTSKNKMARQRSSSAPAAAVATAEAAKAANSKAAKAAARALEKTEAH